MKNLADLADMCFWWLITFLKCIFKNTDQNSMCVSIVFKAALCFGSDLALKTIDKHLGSILKTHKKVVNWQKHNFDCFWWLITF